ncbi:hypothetical protein A5647_11515 [Mycobacterium sp. 1100029.7]|nr:hypothetical protein A5647_11515 [Mycobacterium sp. 1100029.7]
MDELPPYLESSDDWPDFMWEMMSQLREAGIPEWTIFDLVTAPYRYAAAVPIMIDWLENFDKRIPDDDNRPAVRIALIRNLISEYSRGNRRAVEVLFRQFEIEPALSREELRFAAWALRDSMDRSDFPRVAEMIERYSGSLVKAYSLIDASFDYPEAMPIVVDWLENFDERVPSGDARRYVRSVLLRELSRKHAKGNRAAVDILFHQFEIEPPLTNLELDSAGFALVKLCQRSDYPRVAALIRSERNFGIKFVFVRWLGRIKTEEAKELAVSQLSDPGTRIPAMRALVQQQATGVRDAVAEYLDNEHEVFRKEARKTLDKLPAD